MRVKAVYQEHGEWAEARAQPGRCPHPRDRLRFDGSFVLPSFMYCRDCGTRYIVTDEMRAVLERVRRSQETGP